jgi:hypothetical protein
MGNDGAVALANYLDGQKKPILKVLDIKSNFVTEAGFMKLIPSLFSFAYGDGRLSPFRSLNISDNEIGQAHKLLGQLITTSSSLEVLDVSELGWRGREQAAFVEILRQSKSYTTLTHFAMNCSLNYHLHHSEKILKTLLDFPKLTHIELVESIGSANARDDWRAKADLELKLTYREIDSELDS